MNRLSYDVVVIGGGPAGLSASIYAARNNLKVLVLEEMEAGGKLNYYLTIENMPSFTGTSTKVLAENLLKQATDLGVELQDYTDIIKVDLEKKIIETEYSMIDCKSIIIATGSTPAKVGIKGEGEFLGRGVSYCAICDGYFYRDKVVAVIGGGNAALEEADYLTSYARKVYIVHRRDEFRADKVVQEKVLRNVKIEPIYNAVPISIEGKKTVKKLNLKIEGNIKKALEVDGVFVFIGNKPSTDLFKGNIETDEKGYIVTDSSLRTSVKGVYAVGDVRAGKFKQVVTACADGALAGYMCREEI